jgi:hypothetical protein
VVAQTCDDTGQIAEGGIFYGHVLRAIEAGRQLPEDFVVHAVNECVPGTTTSIARFVFVLDEYETLFGDLSTCMISRPELRYRVVQPLLNQLVRFTRDNLLVFMGQQPNAHYILMDQNQLSPVVVQDSFPLFTHSAATPLTGEFYELLRKVMTSNVDLEPEFVTMVYGETGGHPYLTVNVLVAFMDWLIMSRRPVSNLNPVRAELFAEFARHSLTPREIARSEYYRLFRGFAKTHLSENGRTEHPWLYSVYSIMRALRLDSPQTLSCTEDEFNDLAARAHIESPADLLETARAANFFTFDGAQISPRIPLLARIAGAV